MALKHVGRIINNRRKVVVAYRVLPQDPDNCLVVQTENLDAAEHDALMTAVESAAGQDAYEFAEAMARTMLPDGRIMLAGFHSTGKLRVVETSQVEMTPDNNTTIVLSELNKMIAEQQGVTVADLAIKGDEPAQPAPTTETTETVAQPAEAPTATDDGILTDEQLAAQYRSQADSLFKEAKRLREQAEELVPTKRKTKKTEGVAE